MQSGKKKKKESKLDFKLLAKTKKKYASGGTYTEGVSEAAGSIPIWGQLASATQEVSKSIKGDETSGTANAVANSFDPASGITGALDEGDTEGALLAAFNPIGYGFYEADKAEAELKTAKRVATGNVNRVLTKNASTSFKDGGIMLSKRLGPAKGGKLTAISDEAVEVKGNDPKDTDGVEIEDAFLDHGEMVTKDNQVFSDSVFLPNGKSVAKRGKEIEKMRTEHYDPKFGDKSPYYNFLNKKKDDLFAYQETIKEKKAGKKGLQEGGTIDPIRPAKMNEPKKFTDNELLYLRSKLDANPKSKATAEYYYTPEGGISPADSISQAATAKFGSLQSGVPINYQSEAKIDSILNMEQQGKTNFMKTKGVFNKGGGLERSKDYGSNKKPYPSVSSGDFAGGGRSYPIPTKADAVDALRLAGLHGRSDVKSKVYNKYPELKKGKAVGGKLSYDDGGEVEMSKTEFVEEHKNLLKILKSGSAKDRQKEYTKQKKELKSHLTKGGYKPAYENGTEDLWASYNRKKPVEQTQQDPEFQAFFDSIGEEDTAKGKGMDWNKIGTNVATYAPNITNAVLQKKLKGPAAPSLETQTMLKRFSPDPQIAEATRAYKGAQRVVSANTAQASDLISETGSLLAKRFSNENQIRGQVNALNTQIANQEAGMNVGIRQRNAVRDTAFRQSQNDFINKKLQMTSANVGNLSEKVLAQGREKNEIQLDKDKYEALMTVYKDLPEEMKAKYAHLFDNTKLKQKMGGKLLKKKAQY